GARAGVRRPLGRDSSGKGRRMSLVVTGIGMRTAVGQNATQTCAAVRAGINRFAEWPFLDAPIDPDGAPVCAAAGGAALGDGPWIDKFLDLATQPFLESLWNAGLGEVVTSDEAPRWGVFLGVPPDNRAGVTEEGIAEFRQVAEDRELFPLVPTKLELFAN